VTFVLNLTDWWKVGI